MFPSWGSSIRGFPPKDCEIGGSARGSNGEAGVKKDLSDKLKAAGEKLSALGRFL
jgi:hypothetical protein